MGRHVPRNKLKGKRRARNFAGAYKEMGFQMIEDGADSARPDGDAPAAMPPAAARALAEAEARRKARAAAQTEAANEPDWKGPDPTRYGDWEKRGIVSDF